MKHFHFYLALFALLTVSSIYAQDFRTFTGSNGKAIEAILLNYDSDTEIVKIRLKQGNKEQNVKLSLFSSKDQQWIKNQGKGDNPFGDEPAPKLTTAKPSKPIEMQFVLDEAKKAMTAFENANRRNLSVGNMPLVYVDYAAILKCAGQDDEAKKTFEKSVKLNESVSNAKDPTHDAWTLTDRQSNYRQIIEYAIKYGDRKEAQSLLDDALKSGINDNWLVRQYTMLGNEVDAELAVAKEGNNNSKGFGYGNMGDAYLIMGNTDKAKEMFAKAESLGNDWCKHWIITYWIKAGNVEEAIPYVDRIRDYMLKPNSLRWIATYYFMEGNTNEMKKYITEALLKKEVRNAPSVCGILNFFFLINDEATFKKVCNDSIREIEEPFANSKNPISDLQVIVLYSIPGMFVFDTPKLHEVIDKIEALSSKTDKDIKPTVYFWLINYAYLVGETKYASRLIAKAEQYFKQNNGDDKDEKEQVVRLEKIKSCSTNFYVHYQEITDGFPMLIKSGQSDRILPILERIKLPQGRIYALRVIAEELNKK